MTDLRAVVFAYSEVGCACLREILRGGVAVQALFTCEDDPAEEIWFPSAAKLARAGGISVHTPSSLGSEEFRLVESLRPDAIFSFYYRSMIPEKFLLLPPRGAFNMHGSLLPKYRGRACINWAVLRGETETGATLHHMVKRADAGDIVDQQSVPILFEDTALDVSRKVAEAARVLMERNIPLIAEGRAPRRPQDEKEATCFGRRTPADGLINWNGKAVEIYNLVRAVTHPWPGAFTNASGRKTYIWKAFPETDSRSRTIPPGTVLSPFPPRIATGEGVLLVLRSQIEGEGEDCGESLGTVLESGQVLGS